MRCTLLLHLLLFFSLGNQILTGQVASDNKNETTLSAASIKKTIKKHPLKSIFCGLVSLVSMYGIGKIIEIYFKGVVKSNETRGKGGTPQGEDEQQYTLGAKFSNEGLQYAFQEMAQEVAIKANHCGCIGGFDQKKALSLIKEWNKHLQTKKIFDKIFFNENSPTLTSGYIIGGVCSAKTILAIYRFFEFLSYYNALHDPTPDMSRGGVYTQILQNYFGGSLEGATKDDRSVQAALNTIEFRKDYLAKNPPLKELDALKFEAIFCYMPDYFKEKEWPLLDINKEKDVRLDVSKEIIVTDKLDTDQRFIQYIKESLPTGIYFVRFIKRKDNKKKEQKGHSCALFIGKDKETKDLQYLFFDTNHDTFLVNSNTSIFLGNKNKPSASNTPTKTIANYFKRVSTSWDTNSLRIYPIKTPTLTRKETNR